MEHKILDPATPAAPPEGSAQPASPAEPAQLIERPAQPAQLIEPARLIEDAAACPREGAVLLDAVCIVTEKDSRTRRVRAARPVRLARLARQAQPADPPAGQAPPDASCLLPDRHGLLHPLPPQKAARLRLRARRRKAK